MAPSRLLDDAPLPAPIADRPKPKVIRTYGKRAAPDRGTEQPRKRQRISAIADIISSPRIIPSEDATPDATPEATPDSEALPPCRPPTAVPRPATGIMAFFKPVTLSSSSPKFDPKSEPPTSMSSPPSSPHPLPTKKRIPRRLTTRPNFSSRPSSEPRSDRLTDTGGGDSDSTPQPLVTAKRKTNTIKRTSVKKNAIQTTLNLSLNGDLTECRTCGMLYNSVHPKDRKLHARRHAAVLKERYDLANPTSKGVEEGEGAREKVQE